MNCTSQDLTTPSAPGNVRSTRPRGISPLGVRSSRNQTRSHNRS